MDYLVRYYSSAPRSQVEQMVGDGAFRVARCEGCGLSMQLDVPDDEFLLVLYGSWLGHRDPLAPHQPHLPIAEYTYIAQQAVQLLAYLRSTLPQKDRLRVLDFGAGWGHWAQFARSFGAEVVVSELSPPKVTYLRGLGFEVAALSDLEPSSFDLVCTEQVVEHLVEPRSMVAELRKLLRPSGVIKLSVPDGAGIEKILRTWDWSRGYERRDEIMPIQPLEHLNCFTSQSLDRFAACFNLRRIGMPLSIGYGYPFDWSSPRAVMRSLMRPLKRDILKQGCYALYTGKA